MGIVWALCRDQNLDEVRNSLMAFEANAATQYWGALRVVVPDEYGGQNVLRVAQ